MKDDPYLALSFLKRIQGNGALPSVVQAYATVLRIVCGWGLDHKLDPFLVELIRKGDEGRGFTVMDLLKAIGESEQSLVLLSRVSTALVKAYANLEMFDEAIDIFFQTYYSLGRAPDSKALNFLMNRMFASGRTDMLVGVFWEIERLGLDADAQTYVLVVQALCRNEDTEGVEKLLSRLLNSETRKPCVFYMSFIEGLSINQMTGIAYLLLQPLMDANILVDKREVLLSATRLLQAMVDVISSNGWLNLALLAMEVSQMVTQGMWERDSMLLQLPHFTKDLAKRCQENPGKHIETVFDLVEMEDEERQELLKMSDAQLLDIARFCNRFPNIDLTYEVVGSEEVTPGKEVTLQVMLERDMEGRTEVGAVDAPRYPKTKEEGWWLVVGDTKTNQLLAIKRVSLQRKAKVKLDFTVPNEPGEKSYTLYFMCDSYLGCDQEYSLSVDVKESVAGDHMEE
ncbi:unnamed protein product [Arabidopsis halleri]